MRTFVASLAGAAAIGLAAGCSSDGRAPAAMEIHDHDHAHDGHVIDGRVHVIGPEADRCPVCSLYAARSVSVVRIFAAGSLGSGFIVTDKGHVLTNAHVVGEAESVEVELPDGVRFPGRVLRKDEEADLAVVRIEAMERSWTALVVESDFDPPVGSPIFVIGHPLGLGWTVTQGIVSGRRRAGEVASIDLIQTDAAISPGNSGGPVLDEDGRIVGVVRSKIVATGAENIGFVVPANEAAKFLMIAPLE